MRGKNGKSLNKFQSIPQSLTRLIWIRVENTTPPHWRRLGGLEGGPTLHVNAPLVCASGGATKSA